MENIKQCEAIGTKYFSFDRKFLAFPTFSVLSRGRDESESCGIPEDIRKIAYCTFWMNFAKFNTEVKLNCVGSREAAGKCFDLENELTSTAAEASNTGSMATKMSTKPEYGTSDSFVHTESTSDVPNSEATENCNKH